MRTMLCISRRPVTRKQLDLDIQCRSQRLKWLTMRALVSKWGNSLAIRIPRAVAESLRVQAGRAVDLTIEGDTVIMRSCQPRYTIEELVAEMRPGDEPETFDDVNSPPVGRETL